MNIQNYFQKNKGFTIIEMMISIAIFFVVVTIGMSSLLNASAIHQKTQDQRSILDSLTYIMEDMSRNIRTGYNYRCLPSGTTIDAGQAAGVPLNCPSRGATIIFESGNGNPASSNDQWIYKVESNPTTGNLSIYKSVNGAQSWSQPLNLDSIIFDATTGFIVTGALPGDNQQPLVTINLSGLILTKTVKTPFHIETTVSQRLLDAP